jgi:hypothetical protein
MRSDLGKQTLFKVSGIVRSKLESFLIAEDDTATGRAVLIRDSIQRQQFLR